MNFTFKCLHISIITKLILCPIECTYTAHLAGGWTIFNFAWTPPMWPDMTFAPSYAWPMMGILSNLDAFKNSQVYFYTLRLLFD